MYPVVHGQEGKHCRNQKTLDYEIETAEQIIEACDEILVETKRLSITRLKRSKTFRMHSVYSP